MIKAVLFDVDDTLLDFDACAAKAVQYAAAKTGLEQDADAIYRGFCEYNPVLWRRIENGEITRQELRRTRWRLVFSAIGAEGDPLLFERWFARGLARGADAMTGAHELLAYLAPRYRLLIASNAPRAQQYSRLTHAGMLDLFTAVVTSEEVGAHKPDPAFFDACFARLPDVLPGEAMMIGDSLSADIAGAAAYGIHTCWYNPSGLPLPADCHPEHIVDSLTAVREFL